MKFLETFNMPDKFAVPKGKNIKDLVNEEDVAKFRTTLGSGIWCSVKGSPDAAFEISRAAQRINELTYEDIFRLNKTVRYVKQRELKIFTPTLNLDAPIEIRTIVDASDKANDNKNKAQAGRIIGLANVDDKEFKFAIVDWRSGRCRRVTHGSYGAEIEAAVEATEVSITIAEVCSEYLQGPEISILDRLAYRRARTPLPERIVSRVVLFTDSKSLVVAVYNDKVSTDLGAARTRDVQQLKELVLENKLILFHIEGKTNPSDCLTKDMAICKETRAQLLKMLTTGIYVPDLTK